MHRNYAKNLLENPFKSIKTRYNQNQSLSHSFARATTQIFENRTKSKLKEMKNLKGESLDDLFG